VRERRRAAATVTAIFSNTPFDAGIMRNAGRVLVHLETKTMKKLKCFLLLLALTVSAVSAASTAFAAGTAPSDESIRQLLVVTDARKLVEDMTTRMDAQLRSSVQQTLQGKQVTAQQQKVVDNMMEKIVAILHQELAWDSLEATYIRIYRDSFTQEEIDGMLELYKTPAGQAMVKKMPIVMQRSMAELQLRMGPMMQKLRTVQLEAMVELKEQPAR
jgi:hypothetical protein